jgi:hypothetical protein
VPLTSDTSERYWQTLLPQTDRVIVRVRDGNSPPLRDFATFDLFLSEDAQDEVIWPDTDIQALKTQFQNGVVTKRLLVLAWYVRPVVRTSDEAVGRELLAGMLEALKIERTDDFSLRAAIGVLAVLCDAQHLYDVDMTYSMLVLTSDLLSNQSDEQLVATLPFAPDLVGQVLQIVTNVQQKIEVALRENQIESMRYGFKNA